MRHIRAILCFVPLLLAAAHLAAQTAANQPTFNFALPGISFGTPAVDAQGNTYLAGSTQG